MASRAFGNGSHSTSSPTDPASDHFHACGQVTDNNKDGRSLSDPFEERTVADHKLRNLILMSEKHQLRNRQLLSRTDILYISDYSPYLHGLAIDASFDNEEVSSLH